MSEFILTKNKKLLEEGKLHSRSALRSILINEHGYKCFECGLSEWRGSRLPLDLDHIDGNPENDLPNNLRLLCGNCHSITPTWKGKNKGNGRKSRGLDPH
jgi:5-methylcytosine-specific restriction endonuclease McrA